MGTPQIKEQLSLRFGRRNLDNPPVTQNKLVDFRLDPMNRKLDQSNPVFRIEAFDGLHQPNITFLDQIGF